MVAIEFPFRVSMEEKGCREASATTRRWRPGALLHALRLFDGFVDGADHVERLLGHVVAFAVDDHLETTDGFLQRHVLARRAREDFGDVERLRQETLDLAGAGDGEL